MPRKLKTYVTSSGFFELAVAAPSMKAALEIWGGGRDLFQRGYARETSDPVIVKAAMAKPGAVLRRGVGARGAFKEHAELPDVSTWEKPIQQPAASRRPAAPEKTRVEPKTNPAADRKAARLYEAARKKREREAARSEALEKEARERRQKTIKKAEEALGAARDTHDRRIAALATERAKLELSAKEEEERWRNEKRALEAAIRQARA